jgi:hypothetical protein
VRKMSDIKQINVISWGGGTQSTALMLWMLERNYLIDYIIFADTGDENQMVLEQMIKISDYVKKKYDRDIIITKKESKHGDLYQEQLLFFSNKIERTTIVPFYVLDPITKEMNKLPGRQCTVDYKIKQILKEIRTREGLKKFDKRKHKINMFIGFTVDELSRVKDSPSSFIINKYPLVDMNLTKLDCIEYVKNNLGFTPRSSACNMCFALTFDRVFEIYKDDPRSWKKLLDLDDAMEHYDHSRIKAEVFMFKWQAKLNKRLKHIDMDLIKEEKDKYKQLSIFDIYEDEEQMSCSGGCFI